MLGKWGSAIINMDRDARGRKRAEEAEVPYEPWEDINDPTERAYFEGLNKSNVRRVTNQGDGPILGGAGGRLPSMTALAGAGGVGQQPSSVAMNDYLATMDPGNENRRAAASAAALESVGTGIYGARQRQNAMDQDLFSGARQRRSAAEQGVSDQTAYDSYFGPQRRAMREDQERASMAALRQRYADPAIIRGQADLDREMLRNEGRIGQESLRQRGGLMRDAMTGRSRIGTAFATQGDVENATKFGPPAADASLQTFPRARLEEFMLDNGFATAAEAEDMLRQAGYAVR